LRPPLAREAVFRPVDDVRDEPLEAPLVFDREPEDALRVLRFVAERDREDALFALLFVALLVFPRAAEEVLLLFVFVLVFDLALVFDFALLAVFDLDRLAVFDFDFDLVFVFAFDLEPDVFEREVDFLRAEDVRELGARRDEPPPRPREEPSSEPSPASSSSSSEPMSFFATPTAAGIATPSAVPATTFCAVDRPSSSSFDMLTSCATAAATRLPRYLASLNASMNFGTIRSRTISGPCVATYLPAAAAASSASGRSTSDAASQLVAAADARMPEPAARFDLDPFDPPLLCDRSSPSLSSCASAFRTAIVAAVVAAAAAAAFSAVFPELPESLSCTFSWTSWAFSCTSAIR
jgi:hypothetical protein